MDLRKKKHVANFDIDFVYYNGTFLIIDKY